MTRTQFPNVHRMTRREHVVYRAKQTLGWIIALPFIIIVLYELFGYNSPFNMHL